MWSGAVGVLAANGVAAGLLSAGTDAWAVGLEHL